MESGHSKMVISHFHFLLQVLFIICSSYPMQEFLCLYMKASTIAFLVMSPLITIWVKSSPKSSSGLPIWMSVSVTWFYWSALVIHQAIFWFVRICSFKLIFYYMHADQGMGQSTKYQWPEVRNFKFILSLFACYLPFSGFVSISSAF